MQINFLTLFPAYFRPFAEESIVKKAVQANLVRLNIVDFRQFANDKHHHVDDTVYGGGPGMLLAVPPIAKALKSVLGSYKVLLSPQGHPFTQQKALALSKKKSLTLVAGRYEGFDERVRQLTDEEISIGDYVLTGGELPAMVVADAVIRLLPGVINAKSLSCDSFGANNVLDYPQYTKPREFQGMKVPAVLLNGNHKAILAWRKKMQQTKTQHVRPDLTKLKEEKCVTS